MPDVNREQQNPNTESYADNLRRIGEGTRGLLQNLWDDTRESIDRSLPDEVSFKVAENFSITLSDEASRAMQIPFSGQCRVETSGEMAIKIPQARNIDLAKFTNELLNHGLVALPFTLEIPFPKGMKIIKPETGQEYVLPDGFSVVFPQGISIPNFEVEGNELVIRGVQDVSLNVDGVSLKQNGRAVNLANVRLPVPNEVRIPLGFSL